MVNLEEFDKTDVKIIPAAFDAVVVETKVIPAEEAYPNSKYNKDGDQVLVISWENADHKVKNTQKYGYVDKEELNNNSKMGKYLAKYGNFKVGMIVQVFRNSNDFYEISL
jgi:hypothetical protein